MPNCLISNDSEPAPSIEKLDLLQNISDEEASRLQKLWGMDKPISELPGSISLRLDWKASFLAGCWTLVPLTARLTSILETLLSKKAKGLNIRQDELPDYNPSKPLTCQLVVFDLGRATIVRSTRDPGVKSGVETYQHPYAQFPDVTAHLHPCVTIWTSYKAFQARSTKLDSSQLVTYSLLQTIVSLWEELQQSPYEEKVDRVADGDPSILCRRTVVKRKGPVPVPEDSERSDPKLPAKRPRKMMAQNSIS